MISITTKDNMVSLTMSFADKDGVGKVLNFQINADQAAELGVTLLASAAKCKGISEVSEENPMEIKMPKEGFEGFLETVDADIKEATKHIKREGKGHD